ncbi:serine/threonine-protein kinase [Allorhodopirellula solitaria]|uniref:Uncharacterized protein n=1 Tax=Allorhodopirellula solitaria TaxID=2527987 RepID=A0A5C5XU45_9BACT|nr:serine/threonine protein kinase [Allorhodopirellula solitaria]TWT66079.1 hypothetical protein CA85_29410 [Allorhodopirellula solitaria]
MPLPLVDFWKRLVQSGLADSSTPRQWAADFADEHGATPPSDPLTLAKWLVKTGRLKPFQAACLTRPAPAMDAGGTEKKGFRFPVMRIAPLTQAAEQTRPPFSRWLPVTHDASPDAAGVLMQFAPADLTPLDGDRLRWFAALQHGGLPRFELMALPGAPLGNYFTTIPLDSSLDAVGLYAPLPPGESLAVRCGRESSSHWAAEQIAPLLQSLAESMSQLEAGQLSVPPMPSPDRIWVSSDPASGTAATLWIDPSEYLSSGEPGDLATMAGTEAKAGTESPWLYSAPETIAEPGSNPSSWASRSIYALGCLGYRLRFGEHAFAAAQKEQIHSRQLNFMPPALSEAVAQGASGDPLLRVLAYALAKDPDSRFASFETFSRALAATVGPATSTPAPVASAASEAAAEAKAEPAVGPDANEPAPAAERTSAEASGPQSRESSSQSLPGRRDAAPAKSADESVGLTETDNSKKPEVTAEAAGDEKAEKQSEESRPARKRSLAATAEVGEGSPAKKVPGNETPARAVAASDRDDAVPNSSSESAAESPRDPVMASEAAAATATLSEEDPPSAPERRPRRPSRRRAAWLVLGGLWIPIIALVVALAMQDPNAPRPVAKRIRRPVPAVIPSVTGRRPTSRPTPTAPRQGSGASSADEEAIEIVADGQMLWAPPAAVQGSEFSEADRRSTTMLLPPGPAALTTIHLPSLNATGLRETFEPDMAALWQQLQGRIAVPIEDVKLLALAWFPGSDGVPEIAIAVHLKSPRPLDELTQAWEASMAVVPGGARLYAGDDPASDAYYPHFVSDISAEDSSEDAGPDASDVSQTGGAADAEAAGNPTAASGATGSETQRVDAFAVGSIARVTQVAEVEGAPVLLPRQLEELWRSARPTDAVSTLSTPYFLIADSRAWVKRTAPPLLDWIRSTLTPECGGFLVRVVASSPDSSSPPAAPAGGERPPRSGSYVELRLAAAPGKNPNALKSKVLNQIDDASLAAEDFLASREVDPSWQMLAARLPNMWMFTSEQVRSAAIKREVIFNAYLPPLALPQITLGTLLAANTTATPATANAGPMATKLTIDEMLERPMSVSFGQESLQFAIDTIINEFAAELPEGNQAPKVEIIGGDLQKMGITQNQQVRDFAKTDLPLRTVLTDLMLGANPDRTATGPSDPKQALIWVVVGEGDAAEIKITTREAAAGTYDLPKEFQTAE